MKLAIALVAALGVATLAPVASADNCVWIVTPYLSADDMRGVQKQYDSDAWSVVAHDVGPFHAWAYLESEAWNLTLSDTGSGNARFIAHRIIQCDLPQEDIEATCRTEFKAHAEIDDDNFCRVAARMSIRATKIREAGGKVMHSNAIGGVEATDTAYEDGESNGVEELAFEFLGSGVTMPIQWSTGGSKTATVSDSSGGAGGSSPETIYAHNNVETQADIGGIRWNQQYAKGKIYESRWELLIWGTCDGECNVATLLLNQSDY